MPVKPVMKFKAAREKFGITREGAKAKAIGPWFKSGPTDIRIRKMTEKQMAISKKKTISQKFNTAIKRMKSKIIKKENPYIKLAKEMKKAEASNSQITANIVKEFAMYKDNTRLLPTTIGIALKSIGCDHVAIANSLYHVNSIKNKIVIPSMTLVQVLDNLSFTHAQIKEALAESNYKYRSRAEIEDALESLK